MAKKSKLTQVPPTPHRPLFLPKSLPPGYSNWQEWYSQNPNPPTLPVKSTSPKAGEEIDMNRIYHRQTGKETGMFNPLVVKGLTKSSKGALGMAQAMPAALAEYKKKFKEDIDVTIPENSVKFQKWMMGDLMGRNWINHPSNESDTVKVAKALAAYNYGPTNVINTLNKAKQKGIDIYSNKLEWLKELPEETSDYVNKILLAKDPKFEKEYAEVKDKYWDLYSPNVPIKEDGGPVYNWIPPNYPRVGARNKQGGWLDKYEYGGNVPHDYMYSQGNVSSYRPGTSIHPIGITNVPDSPCGPGFTIQYDETGNPVCMPIAELVPSAPTAPTPVLAGASQRDYALFNPAIYNQSPLVTYSVEKITRGRNKEERFKPTKEERQATRKAIKASNLHRRPFLSGIGQFFRNIERCLPGDDCYKFEAGGDVKKYARKGEIYNERRADELGYIPDAAGHLPSVDYETSEWLKSAQHPTAWKEYLYGYTLNPAVSTGYNLGFDFGGYFGKNQLKYYPKKEDGGSIEDQKIPDTTAYEFGNKFMAYPDKTLTNYQMGTPKSTLPDGKIVDATPEIPAYAHGATVWNKRLADEQMSAAYVVGPDTKGTQVKNTYPDRMSGAENPTNYRIGDVIPTGMDYKSPAAGTYDYNKDVQPYYTMRLHARDTRRMAYGGYVPAYKKGGFLSTLGDIGLGIVDSSLSSVGSVTGIKSMQDMIDEDQYANDKFDDVAGFTGKIAGTALKVIPVTAPFAAAAGAVGTVANRALKIDEKNYDPSKHTSAWDKWGSGIETVGSIASMAMGNVSGAAGAANTLSKAAQTANTITKGANLVNAGMSLSQGLGQGQVNLGSIMNIASSLQGLQGNSGLNKTSNLGGVGDINVGATDMMFAKHGGPVPGLRWHQLNPGVSAPKGIYTGPTTQRGITFEDGGDVPPYVTSDPKEFTRRKNAYSDSLNIYNKYIQFKNRVANTPINTIDEWVETTQPYPINLPNNRAIAWDFQRGSGSFDEPIMMSAYKKPVQKVIFNPEIIKMPMRGISPLDVNVEADVKSRPTYRNFNADAGILYDIPEHLKLGSNWRTPQKKANGGDVSPYITFNRAEYEKRLKDYNDSTANYLRDKQAYESVNNITQASPTPYDEIVRLADLNERAYGSRTPGYSPKPKQKVILAKYPTRYQSNISKMPMRGLPSDNIEAMPQKVKVPESNPLPTQYMDTRGEFSNVPQVPPVYTEEQLLKMGYRAPKKKNGGWLDNL